jgi:hypothetical protein
MINKLGEAECGWLEAALVRGMVALRGLDFLF